MPPHPWQWRVALWRIRRALRSRTNWVPVAPLAAVMVLALVVGLARLAFTGTVRFASGTGDVVAGAVVGDDGRGDAVSGAGGASTPGAVRSRSAGQVSGAVLVVDGFGSTCCHSANALRAAEPNLLVRQFSYVGLNAAGQPIPYGRAGDLPIQVLGDRMAAQVDKLYQQARTPVDIVAESVSEVGASYFAQVSRDTGRPWLAVVPLADAVTLPACPWPQNVIFIDAFHGGLLGDRSVQQMIEAFLASGTVPDRELAGLAGGSQRDLRGAAQVIAAAASAWRMPDLHSACPPS